MHSDLEGEQRRIAVPGYPGLYLLATDASGYSDELLIRLARCLAQIGAAPAAPVAPGELRAALRQIGRPDLLAEHPLAMRLGRPADQRGVALELALRAAIDRLDRASHDRRGPIMRLRYLDGLSVKELRGRLYLSESHYHRLHAAALAWLARDLALALSSDRDMGAS